MKRLLILLVATMINWSMLSAQTHQSFDKGYVFITNLKAYSQRSLKSRVKSTISAGRVAIFDGHYELNFPHIDYLEYIVLESGTFHKYQRPTQEENVPFEYISSAAFNKAVRKVNIYKQAPTNWELGKVYTFKPLTPNEYVESIKVRTLRLSSDDVTLVTEVDDDFMPSSSISISGETIVEISLDDIKVYWYKGQQLKCINYYTGNDDSYYSLVVDDKGITYSQNEKGVRKIDTKLTYVLGEYPDVDYFGWISDTEIVVDDLLYVAASTSAKKP